MGGDLALKPGRKIYVPAPKIITVVKKRPLVGHLRSLVDKARENAKEARARRAKKAEKARTYGPSRKRNRPSKKQRLIFPKSPSRPKGSKPFANNVIVPGYRTISTTTPDGHGGAETQVTVQSVIAWQKIYGGYSTSNGDHKHPNPHSYDYTVIDYGGGTNAGYAAGGPYYTVITGTQAYSMNLSFPFVNDTATPYNTALDRLYEAIRGSVDLSIDLAEAHKTKKMMSDTLKGMKNLSLTFYKMKRSNPRDWGNLWLEFTYGWKPLASSIYGGLQRALGHNPSMVQYLTSSARETHELSVIEETAVFGGYNRKTQKGNARNSVRMKVLMNIQQDRLDELAGFTSLNPVSIAWELTPYSFVVDWFLNVGGYLRNYESALLYGSSFVEGYTDELQINQGWEYQTGNFSNFTGDGYHSCRGSRKEVRFARHILSGAPEPRLPSFAPHLGSSRLLSAASLLGQQLHSLKHLPTPQLKLPRYGIPLF
jgi:hypothetical protein